MSAPDDAPRLGSRVIALELAPVMLLVGLYALWLGLTQGTALMLWAGVVLTLVGGGGTALLAWLILGPLFQRREEAWR